MHHLHQTAAVVLLSLSVGCGGQSEPAAPARAGGPARQASADATPQSPFSHAQPSGPKTPQIEIPETSQLPTRDGRNPVQYNYEVMLDSRCTTQAPDGQTAEVDAHTLFAYAWRWRGNEAELRLRCMEVRTAVDGQPMMESTMSGSHFYLQQGGQTMDTTFENANPQLRQVLQDCFRTPMCRVLVDNDGRELERTITAGPAARPVVETGIIANARLFHGPFPAAQNTWQAAGEMAMGNGGYARGNLTYETLGTPAAPGDESANLVEVKVSGTLTGDVKLDVSEIKNAVYKVEGTQVYSKRLREWVSGALVVRLSFETHALGKKVTNTGTVQLAMKLVSSQELPPVRITEGAGPELR